MPLETKEMIVREQRILVAAGLVITTIGGVALLMDVVIVGAIALGAGALIGLACIVSRWFNDE